MFSKNRIERIEASVCRAGSDVSLYEMEFDVSIPQGENVHSFWKEALDSHEGDCFVIPNKEEGNTRLLMVLPEDRDKVWEVAQATGLYDLDPNADVDTFVHLYLFGVVAESIHRAHGFHLLTDIISTYGEQSPYESEHAILAKTPVRDFNALALELNRTRGIEGDVSEELWQEAVDTLVALREQAELELTECESLSSVFENELTTEFVDDLLGGREKAAALTERTAASLEELTKKVKAINRVLKHLDKLRAFIERDVE